MKAIETVYANHRFRSRLEARYAVFFNTLGVKWQYEKEGFDLDGLYYLPDFWLPELRYWVEIKGEEPTETDLEKCSRLAQAQTQESEIRVFISGSLPQEGSPTCLAFLRDGHIERREWLVCPWCGLVGITEDADLTAHCMCVGKYFRFDIDEAIDNLHAERDLETAKYIYDKYNKFFYFKNIPRIEKAFNVARQARFEHGEKPL
jgi:hypothetical protein